MGDDRALGDVGSIPAHTGEPSTVIRPPRRTPVYPRTHGGTGPVITADSAEMGLSPHTRGNPRHADRAGNAPGSIPAHTGEPPHLVHSKMWIRVYPRTHGGTDPPDPPEDDQPGLSPHTRGNPAIPALQRLPHGSIPAHTGEPRGVCAAAIRSRVYPRTHGGTRTKRGRIVSISGLSPHTRGNPPRCRSSGLR